MSIQNHSWAVDGNALKTRPRQGGRVALKGFEFQASHAVHYITQLLTINNGLVQVRYEGAQDVDLMFGDGRQLYVQYKDSRETAYTFDSVLKILHGFMRDTIDACGNPPDINKLEKLKLEFMFVATGVFAETDMLKAMNKTCTPSLAKILAANFEYAENQVKSAADKNKFSKYVLKNVSFRLSPTIEDNDEPRLLSIARLALFGVPPAQIEASIAKISGLLKPPGNTFSADVARCLHGLPDHHPASGRSCINILPSENIFPDRRIVEQEFRESGRVSWQAIHHQLDVERDAAEEIHAKVRDIGNGSGVILVTGVAASGKSTVIRRVAWDIHRAGKALVFEMTNPSALNSDAWDEVTRLAALTKKPAVIVTDDISLESSVFYEFRRSPHGNVIVIASSKSKTSIPKQLPVTAVAINLDKVSDKEINLLGGQLGKKISVAQKSKLSNFMTQGNFFALSLVLRNTSLDTLAKQTWERLSERIPQLCDVYLSLCSCGVYDQSIPTSLLNRIQPSESLWTLARSEHFVFDEINDRIRSAHAALSKSILEHVKPNVQKLKINLLDQININTLSERRFALGLLQNGLDQNSSTLAAFSDQLEAFSNQIIPVGDYLDLWRLNRVLQVVIDAGATKLKDVQIQVLEAASSDRVRTGHDAVNFMRHSGEFETAFPVVAKVFESPDISFGRSSFMRWVSEQARGKVGLQLRAVELHFAWLKNRNFPLPETEALVNCIGNGNTILPEETHAIFVEYLLVILDKINFPPRNQSEQALLYSACESNLRLNSSEFFQVLIERIRDNYADTDLAGDVKLIRYLKRLACKMGKSKARLDVFTMIAPLLHKVNSADIITVSQLLVPLGPPSLKEFLVGWTIKFGKARPATAVKIATSFTNDFKLRETIEVAHQNA